MNHHHSVTTVSTTSTAAVSSVSSVSSSKFQPTIKLRKQQSHHHHHHILHNEQEIDQLINEKHLAETLYLQSQQVITKLQKKLKKSILNEQQMLNSTIKIRSLLKNIENDTRNDNIKLCSEINDLHKDNYHEVTILLEELDILQETSKIIEKQMTTTTTNATTTTNTTNTVELECNKVSKY